MKPIIALFVLAAASVSALEVELARPEESRAQRDCLDVYQLRLSRDARRYALRLNRGGAFDKRGLIFRGGRSWVVLDGRAGPAYDYVTGLVFSPDSRRFGYIAVNGAAPLKNGRFKALGRYRAVIDGKPGPVYDRVAHLKFGSHGRYQYWAVKATQWYCIIGGTDGGQEKRLGPYRYARYFKFAPDGKRYVFIYQRAGQTGSRFTTEYLHLDGKSSGPFMRIDRTRFSADGRRFMVSYSAKGNRKYYVRVDHRRFGPYQFTSKLAFSRNGRSWGFMARYRRGRDFLVYNGRAVHRRGRVFGFVLSPDGTKFAVITIAYGKQVAVYQNGKRFSKTYKGLAKMVYSADSRHLAFVGVNYPKNYLTVDKRVYPDRMSVTDVGFAPNGAVVCVENYSGYMVRVGDRVSPKYSAVGNVYDPKILFDDRGRSYYFASERGKGPKTPCWKLFRDHRPLTRAFDKILLHRLHSGVGRVSFFAREGDVIKYIALDLEGADDGQRQSLLERGPETGEHGTNRRTPLRDSTTTTPAVRRSPSGGEKRGPKPRPDGDDGGLAPLPEP